MKDVGNGSAAAPTGGILLWNGEVCQVVSSAAVASIPANKVRWL